MPGTSHIGSLDFQVQWRHDVFCESFKACFGWAALVKIPPSLLCDHIPLKALVCGELPPVAPGHNDDAASRGANARELAHKAFLVGHVLPALHAPDQVKGCVWKGLLQCVSHLKGHPVRQALLLC